MRLKTYAEDFLVHLNVDYTPAPAAVVLRIREPVSHILAQQLNITSTDVIAQCDWLIYSAWSVISRHMTELRIPRCTQNWSDDAFSLFSLRDVYVASGFRCTAKLQLTNDLKPAVASCSTFDLCLLLWERPARIMQCSLSIDFISYRSLFVIKNSNGIPL